MYECSFNQQSLSSSTPCGMLIITVCVYVGDVCACVVCVWCVCMHVVCAAAAILCTDYMLLNTHCVEIAATQPCIGGRIRYVEWNDLSAHLCVDCAHRVLFLASVAFCQVSPLESLYSPPAHV